MSKNVVNLVGRLQKNRTPGYRVSKLHTIWRCVNVRNKCWKAWCPCIEDTYLSL